MTKAAQDYLQGKLDDRLVDPSDGVVSEEPNLQVSCLKDRDEITLFKLAAPTIIKLAYA